MFALAYGRYNVCVCGLTPVLIYNKHFFLLVFLLAFDSKKQYWLSEQSFFLNTIFFIVLLQHLICI